jgi:hypothetical protein
MSHVIFIVGLPGAGKTTHLPELEREGYVVFDDYKACAQDDSPHFRKSRHYHILLQLLRKGTPCAICDIDFCKEDARVEAETVLREDLAAIEIEWRFFDSDLEACASNIKQRNREHADRDLEKLLEYAATYSIPAGAIVLPVVRAPQNATPG